MQRAQLKSRRPAAENRKQKTTTFAERLFKFEILTHTKDSGKLILVRAFARLHNDPVCESGSLFVLMHYII